MAWRNHTEVEGWLSNLPPFASPSKRVFVRNNSYVIRIQVHFHFYVKGFARRLVLKLSHKGNLEMDYYS